METEGLSRWRVSGQVCCVSIPPGCVLPHWRHVNAGSTNLLGGAGPPTAAEHAAMRAPEEMCACAAGEAGGLAAT